MRVYKHRSHTKRKKKAKLNEYFRHFAHFKDSKTLTFGEQHLVVLRESV